MRVLLIVMAGLLVGRTVGRSDGRTIQTDSRTVGRSDGRGQLADSTRSTRDSVYSATQATRGKEVYLLNCQSCHTPVSHTGAVFVEKWEGHRLSELYEFIRTAMPKSDPGSLTQREYIVVLAYLLKMNGMPAGKDELPADSLELQKIRIELKSGSP